MRSGGVNPALRPVSTYASERLSRRTISRCTMAE